jgi:hypothetical protein
MLSALFLHGSVNDAGKFDWHFIRGTGVGPQQTTSFIDREWVECQEEQGRTVATQYC